MKAAQRFSILYLFILCCSCALPLTPLSTPVASSHVVVGGAHIVIADNDLPALVQTIRTRAGSQVPLETAPWPITGLGDAELASFSSTISINSGVATWLPDGRLQLEFALAPLNQLMAVTTSGQATCSMAWQAAGGTLHVIVQTGRQANGSAGPTLDAEPTLTLVQAAVVDTKGCLQGDAAATAAVAAHFAELLGNALGPRYGQAAVAALRATFPASLEVQGQLGVASRWSELLTVRISNTYQASAPSSTQLIAHQGTRAVAHLDVGLDLDHSACAVDVPPPQQPANPLPPDVPNLPSEQAFLRRALVVDEAALAHVGWAIARSGMLCQDTHGPLTGLGANWSEQAFASLTPWLQGPPTGTRFWPQSSPELRMVDTPTGPALEVHLSQALLEIVAPVAGTDFVVLRIRGGFRIAVQAVAMAGSTIGWQYLSTQVESTVVTSPFAIGGTDQTSAGLPAVVDAALAGIIQTAPVLPMAALLPPGTVMTGVARSGHGLWLWLDGGADGTGI